MLKSLYDWMMAKAEHPQAIWWLAAVSFIESSFFPIPPDVMLIPMVIAAPSRWLRIAVICTISSVIGGFLGYAIGYFLIDTVGMQILNAFKLVEAYGQFKCWADKWGVWVIILKGWTPIPYKLITIAAGGLKFDLLAFAFASVIARSMRFFLVAALLWRYGEQIRAFVERRLKLVTTLFVVALVGGFLAVKMLKGNGGDDCPAPVPSTADTQPIAR